MFNRKDRKGFTLVEIILFIVVFSVGVVGIMSVFYNTLGKTGNPLVRDRAIQVAQAAMENIFNKKWDENTPNGGCKEEDYALSCNYSNSSIGADSGETGINDYDDVDDYVSTGSSYKKYRVWQSEDLGLSEGFNVKVTVSYANVDSTGKISENTASKTNYKMITVEVSGNGLGETYTLKAVKANF